MSDLSIRVAGATQTPEDGFDNKKGAIIRVTPAIHAASSTDNDVMCLTTEIPKAVNKRGGVSRLVNIGWSVKQLLTLNLDVIIMQVSKDFTDADGNACNISDDDLVAAKVCAALRLEKPVPIGLNGNEYYNYSEGGNEYNGQFPIMLQAEPDSTSVYFTVIDRDGGDTFTASDLTFAFHIEYL